MTFSRTVTFKTLWSGVPKLLLPGLYILFLTAHAQAAGRIFIAYPEAGAVLRGPVTFSCSLQDLSAAASVEYLLNGKRLDSPVSAPYSYSWHTAYAWNGSYTLEAVARDGAANEIARSAKVSFIISTNSSNITLTSVTPGTTVSGILKLNPAVTLAPGRSLERFLVSLDGAAGSPHYGLTGTEQIDTRNLRNGPHEIVVNAFDGLSLQSGAALLYLPVIADNGHTLQQLRLGYGRMFLTPGGSIPLSVRAVYTDGQEQRLTTGIVYSSDSPSVARVDASGVVTAVSSGVVNLTATAQGKSTTAQIFVDAAHGFAHFSKGGKILDAYDPTGSIFLRTVFFLDPTQALTQVPALAGEIQKASINAFSTGLYSNPVDSGQPATFEVWKSGWDGWWSSVASAARSNNVGIFFTGDDLARNRPELLNSIAGSYSNQAIQHAFTTARDSGLAVAMDAVDEVSFFWGDNPAPADNRWLAQQPAVPNDAFTRLMTTINGVPNRMPISWPIAGLHGGVTAKNWFAPQFSDYSSHYWTFLDNRFTYPWDASLNQYRSNMDRTLNDRLPLIDRKRPMILLASANGNGYTKLGPGNTFVPGQDSIEMDGPTPRAVTAQIMFAVVRGMAGVRVYGYDSPAWKSQRSLSPVGTGGLQIGTDPFGEGQNRWQAMSASFNLIKRLEADLLQPQSNALDLGPDIVTGAKQGPGSRVFMALNMAEAAATETLDFSGYLYPGSTAIERYRIVESDVIADSISSASTIQQSFEPGQTVIWVFRPASAVTQTAPPPQVQVPSSPTISMSVSLSLSTPEATIRYTLTGAEPDANSPVYVGPFTVAATTRVKAKAFVGPLGSATSTASVSTDSGQLTSAIPPATPAGASAIWKFSDGAGHSVADSSGHNQTVNLFNGPAWMTGTSCQTGACLSFDGSNDYGSTTLDLSATKVVTVAFWMNWDHYANNDSLAMEFGADPYGYNSSTTGFIINPNSSLAGGGQFEVSMKGDAGYSQMRFQRPSAASWHHLAFVLDKSGPALTGIVPYVDGVPVVYTRGSSAANTNAFGRNQLVFMSRSGTALFGAGRLSDVEIFSRALSATEIKTLAGH